MCKIVSSTHTPDCTRLRATIRWGTTQTSCGVQKAGLLAEAEEAWLTAVALDPGLAPALSSLGHVEGAKGNIEGVRGRGGKRGQYFVGNLVGWHTKGDEHSGKISSGRCLRWQ